MRCAGHGVHNRGLPFFLCAVGVPDEADVKGLAFADGQGRVGVLALLGHERGERRAAGAGDDRGDVLREAVDHRSVRGVAVALPDRAAVNRRRLRARESIVSKPRSQTNLSGSSRSRNVPMIFMPASSWLSTKLASNRSMRTSRIPGWRVYCRSSTIGDQRIVEGSQRTGVMARSSTVALDGARWWRLERRAGETLRAALERTLREAIVSGSLRAGVRLPGSRALACDLGVSRGVVSDAYAQLEAQGLLVSRMRAAPTVASISRPPKQQPDSRPREAIARFDLTPTTPDVMLFPLSRWLAASQRAARQVGPTLLDYRDPRGEWRLRQTLADHLGRTRGVIADPHQIIITQGAAQSVQLLVQTLRARGATSLALEDPSHTAQHERARAAGLTVLAQPVDEHGLIVEGLEGDAVLVTPAHQFPTGSVLSGERRRQLLAWAAAGDRLIFEDDYDAEFRYDTEPVRSLQGLAPNRVAQIGTVSKTLAPGLRLGWIVAPDQITDELEREKRLADDFSPSLDQLALAEIMSRGDYHRHVRSARSVYRRRRDTLLAALARHLPELEEAGAAAGMHLLLRLPTTIDDATLSSGVSKVGVRAPALSAFCIDRNDLRGLVIGYGRLHESAVEHATRALAHAVREQLAA
jgi:GntR family transcriptional regulator / MocR family aminotransferase